MERSTNKLSSSPPPPPPPLTPKTVWELKLWTWSVYSCSDSYVFHMRMLIMAKLNHILVEIAMIYKMVHFCYITWYSYFQNISSKQAKYSRYTTQKDIKLLGRYLSSRKLSILFKTKKCQISYQYGYGICGKSLELLITNKKNWFRRINYWLAYWQLKHFSLVIALDSPYKVVLNQFVKYWWYWNLGFSNCMYLSKMGITGIGDTEISVKYQPMFAKTDTKNSHNKAI